MRTLTVKLENRVYHSFQNLAQKLGKTPAEIIAQWVEVAIEQNDHPRTDLSAENVLDELPANDTQTEETMSGEPDPLLALAGTLEYKTADLSERHDEYIGQTLLTEMQGNNDE